MITSGYSVQDSLRAESESRGEGSFRIAAKISRHPEQSVAYTLDAISSDPALTGLPVSLPSRLPFSSSSSSSCGRSPCTRVPSTIIYHPVLFGTLDKFRECWCNYIKHKSVITSLRGRNEERAINAYHGVSVRCNIAIVSSCSSSSGLFARNILLGNRARAASSD